MSQPVTLTIKLISGQKHYSNRHYLIRFVPSFVWSRRKKKKDRNSNFILLERDKEEGVFSSLAPSFSRERERENRKSIFSLRKRERERDEINHRSSASNRETDEESYGMECVIVVTRSSTR